MGVLREVGSASTSIVKSLQNIAGNSGAKFGAPTVGEGFPL